MSSQIRNQNNAPLANRYIDALHQSASTRSNIMETNGTCTIEANGRPRTSRSNSPGRKKQCARPTPEELVHTQGQSGQRFPSTRPSTTPSSFSLGSPRATFDTGFIRNTTSDTGFTSLNPFPGTVSGGYTPQRSPVRLRDSLVAASTSTFQVIPVASSGSTDIDWEDDFSSSSYAENTPKGIRISAGDTAAFSSPRNNPDGRKFINEYSSTQEDGSEETTGSENEADNSTPSGSSLRSVKDRIKSIQMCQTTTKESSPVATLTPNAYNGEQDQNDNEDKENGENWSNNNTKKTSTTTFGAISQGGNVNAFSNGPGHLPVPASNPNSSQKKTAVTASFLVAINKYSPRQQQEKAETQLSKKDSKPTLRILTTPVEIKDNSAPSLCMTPSYQGSLGECSASKGSMPTPGSSSTLIASWRQREASNVAVSLPNAHSSSKKISSVPVLQSKFVECDTNSDAGSTESSLTSPPVMKTIKRTSTPSLKSLSVSQMDSLSTFIDQQVESRLSQLEAQMERDFKDKLEKMEAKMETRINIKMERMMNLFSVQK